MKNWIRYMTFKVFEDADDARSVMLNNHEDLKQGENIQIKYLDGAFQLRIAKDLVSEETRKNLFLK